MRTIRTPQKRAAFLAALSNCGNVTQACRIANIGRTAIYQWRCEDHGFAAVWDDAADLGADALEDEAARRAADGTLKPVFYQGVECGAVREYSDALLIFLLKARRPERFKDRVASQATATLRVSEAVDRPPLKTRDEWLARRERDLIASRMAMATGVMRLQIHCRSAK